MIWQKIYDEPNNVNVMRLTYIDTTTPQNLVKVTFKSIHATTKIHEVQFVWNMLLMGLNGRLHLTPPISTNRSKIQQ